eukprot:190401-Rhodomonas_salina.2
MSLLSLFCRISTPRSASDAGFRGRTGGAAQFPSYVQVRDGDGLAVVMGDRWIVGKVHRVVLDRLRASCSLHRRFAQSVVCCLDRSTLRRLHVAAGPSIALAIVHSIVLAMF